MVLLNYHSSKSIYPSKVVFSDSYSPIFLATYILLKSTYWLLFIDNVIEIKPFSLKEEEVHLVSVFYENI